MAAMNIRSLLWCVALAACTSARSPKMTTGGALQLSTNNADNHARIGRDAVMQSLPSALIYELSRTA